MNGGLKAMEVKACKSCGVPKYPTQKEVLRDRSLLSYLPRRWQRNKVVLTAATTLVAMSMSSCAQSRQATSNNQDKVLVAPVYKHILPTIRPREMVLGYSGAPVGDILSDEDAYEIIIKKAKSMGIHLIRNEVKIENTNFESDLSNKAGTIAIEFISIKDNIKNEILDTNTVDDAESHVRKLQGAESSKVKAVGFFYDPFAEDSEKQLRLQVKDFMNWLKGQGIV